MRASVAATILISLMIPVDCFAATSPPHGVVASSKGKTSATPSGDVKGFKAVCHWKVIKTVTDKWIHLQRREHCF